MLNCSLYSSYVWKKHHLQSWFCKFFKIGWKTCCETFWTRWCYFWVWWWMSFFKITSERASTILSDAKKRGPFKRMFFLLHHPLQIVVGHHRNLCHWRNLSSKFWALWRDTGGEKRIITRPSFPGWHGGARWAHDDQLRNLTMADGQWSKSLRI